VKYYPNLYEVPKAQVLPNKAGDCDRIKKLKKEEGRRKKEEGGF
jgi:hypothetical protein